MKIAIVGVGAMGAIYAGLLADAGHEVWGFDLWKEHTDAIATNGLRIEGPSGNRVVKGIHIGTSLNDLGEVELVIIATKASGVAAAAQGVQSILTPDTIVLTIQNGLGAGERIARYLPDENILLGVAEGFGASVKSAGCIQHTAMKMIRIGAMAGGSDPRCDSVVEMWRDAGFTTKAYSDIHQLIWEKFICNVAYSAPCTVFGKSVSELMADEHAVEISRTCAMEAWNVAVEKGINLSFDDPIEYVTEFGHKVGNARPSMLLDHRAHRVSEIDSINGMVPVVAREKGLSAPYNEVLSGIVRSRERAWISGIEQGVGVNCNEH